MKFLPQIILLGGFLSAKVGKFVKEGVLLIEININFMKERKLLCLEKLRFLTPH